MVSLFELQIIREYSIDIFLKVYNHEINILKSTLILISNELEKKTSTESYSKKIIFRCFTYCRWKIKINSWFNMDTYFTLFNFFTYVGI